jgi:hypothetical protein
MKFGVDVVQLRRTTLKSTVQFLAVGSVDMAGEQTFEVGSTLAPHGTGPYNDIWSELFGKYKILEQ